MRRCNDNPLLLQDPTFEQVRDVLEQMRSSEATTYRRKATRPGADPFTGLWRQQIIQWMFTFVNHCKLHHEAASAAAFYLDAAVARGVVRSSQDVQLGAITSMYLALKVYDSPCMRVVKLSNLVKLGHSNFTAEDITRMERELLQALGWRVNVPTPNCFLQQYLVLLPIQQGALRKRIESLAYAAIERALADDSLAAVEPSILGYAALLSALDQCLEQQKARVPGCCLEVITLWQIQSFLYSMSNIANLNHTNILITETLARMEALVLPPAVASSKHRVMSKPSPCAKRQGECNDMKNVEEQSHKSSASIPSVILAQ